MLPAPEAPTRRTGRCAQRCVAATCSIATVMREQPGGLADRTLFEIVLMAHQFGRRRLRALNARAVEENVNLAMTLNVADFDTGEWVARNALPHGRTAPARPGRS